MAGYTLTGNPISAMLSSASQMASSVSANMQSINTNMAAQNSTTTLGNTVSNSMDQGAGSAEDTMTKANEIQKLVDDGVLTEAQGRQETARGTANSPFALHKPCAMPQMPAGHKSSPPRPRPWPRARPARCPTAKAPS